MLEHHFLDLLFVGKMSGIPENTHMFMGTQMLEGMVREQRYACTIFSGLDAVT